MYYSGKKLDTFAYAMQQLLEFNGETSVKHLDCASLRCFGFAVRGEVKKWFCPFLTVEEAVRNLSQHTGIPFYCKKISSVEELGECSVIGPVDQGIAVPRLQNYYYRGEGSYLFAVRAGDEFEVYDPQGFFGLRMEYGQLERIVDVSGSYSIWKEGYWEKDKNWDDTSILRSGLEFHEKIWEEEKAEMKRAFQGYRKGVGNQISLQYGLQNLLLQIDQVFILALECGALSMKYEEEYMRLKQVVYEIAESEEVRRLPKILEHIWKCLLSCCIIR